MLGLKNASAGALYSILLGSVKQRINLIEKFKNVCDLARSSSVSNIRSLN